MGHKSGRTEKSRSLFPEFLFFLKRSSIARIVIETAGDLKGHKSRRQTYLAAATATTLVWKQLRVSLPPNPPPKEHKKDTTHESRTHTREICPRGSAYGRLQSSLSKTKTIDYKMMVIILKEKLTHSFGAYYYSISRNS